jgi:hypothetical protein
MGRKPGPFYPFERCSVQFLPEKVRRFMLLSSIERLPMAKNKQENISCKAIRYQLYGWILFITCALLFIAESVISREPLVFVGSIIFLLACILFLIPLIDALRDGNGKGRGSS